MTSFAFRAGVLMLLFSLAAGLAQAESRTEAPIRSANRTIAVLRGEVFGMQSQERATHAERRIEALRELPKPPTIDAQPVSIGNVSGVAVMADGRILFTITANDLDPEAGTDPATEAKDAVGRLGEALEAYRAETSWKSWLKGTLYALAASALAGLLLWGAYWLARHLDSYINVVIDRTLARAGGASWASHSFGLVLRISQIVLVLLALFVVGLWVTFVLHQFQITAPLGGQLVDTLRDELGELGSASVGAAPGLIAIVIIVLVAQAVAAALRNVFSSVQAGMLTIPGIHPDTAGATRRIVIVAVWAFAFALAYPYIPGSNSDVFRGVSVLLGFLLTLGSAGLVNQLMSGLVITYSRALRKGDYVRVGDIEGVVQELGALSAKVMNVRNEEITIPNTVLVSSAIYNYSRLSEPNGTLATTKVTIGYDAAWRQVHAMLMQAAAAVDGIRTQPGPYVYQRALNDFYVEYELFFYIGEPMQRVPILSRLHAAIQDAFNEAGVQIMSPHFMVQPDQPVISPKSQWFASPAQTRNAGE